MKVDTTATRHHLTRLGQDAQPRADTHRTDERAAIPPVLPDIRYRMADKAGYVQEHKGSLPQYLL